MAKSARYRNLRVYDDSPDRCFKSLPFFTNVVASSQSIVEMTNANYKSTGVLFVKSKNKSNIDDLPDSHVDEINIKFGKAISPDARNRTNEMVHVVSRLVDIPEAELWRCLYYFDSTKNPLPLSRAMISCANTILSR